MKIVLASDHRGFELKEKIKKFLDKKGYYLCDSGTDSSDRADYPLYAKKGADIIKKTKDSKGVFICGSGLGICIAANKVRGIRAVTVRSSEDARMGVMHNNANVICLGADRTGFKKASKIIMEFLNGSFEGGRHQNRLNMIKDIENAGG